MPQPPAIEMRGIVKRFVAVIANDNVDLTVQQGEIHALLGENGAGKSTLMQILYGFHRMDAGEVLVHGAPVSLQSPKDAIALGIGMVHQEFMLVDSFSVVDNVVLGLPGRGLLDLDGASEKLRALSLRHHLAIDPRSRVSSLPIGVQQRVEILKLLYRDARVLILDEPTAVLTLQEKNHLFQVLRGLRDDGCSIIIVTHKLNEIMELADRVTVMRDGRVLTNLATADTTGDELARLMVGRDVNLHATKSSMAPGACLLAIQDLHVSDASGQEKVRGLSFDVHAGEIFGIAGVDGNGQSELAQAIMNLLPASQGKVLVEKKDVTHQSVGQHHARGIVYVPADRRGVGSVPSLSIAENALLGSQRQNLRGPFLDRGKIRAHALNLITRFGVRGGGMDTQAGRLSGGNLQKVILGREIMRAAKVLIVEQPTRGLDVGAIEAVWKELLRERERGTAILLISAELEELLNLADRIAVMFEGRIVGIVGAAKTNVEELGIMMAGTSVPSAKNAPCLS